MQQSPEETVTTAIRVRRGAANSHKSQPFEGVAFRENADSVQMDGDLGSANSRVGDATVLGRFAHFASVPACLAFIIGWLWILVTEGSGDGLKYSWALALAVPLGIKPLLARLRLSGSILEVTVIGPWRQAVDLDALESVHWKHTGAPASRGSMFVRDSKGGQVRIGVGDFTGVDTWGPLILAAAEKHGASVDRQSSQVLQGEGRRDRPKADVTTSGP